MGVWGLFVCLQNLPFLHVRRSCQQRAQALIQHHDAVTGTSKQHVADDYAQRLDRAWVDVEAAVSAALSRQAFGWKVGRQEFDGEFPELSQCRMANISVCDITMEVGLAAI